jgi:exonuclease SbcC
VRPVELSIAGFTAYRDDVTIDFRDTDLFALTGPTGSGKSSIVDAIVFALYGSVPRYLNKNMVEPVIALGKNEARIRFDFTAGSNSYTVVRVVRRTKNGATTAEARLEHGGDPVASGADEVTRKVEEILGLTYEHFIKAVVLPQGEFARFLHDTKGKRQELLRELLDLDVYLRIRDLANERKSQAEQALAGHRREVDLLAGRAGSDEQAAARRLAELERLRDSIIGIRAEIIGLDEKLDDTKKQIARDEETLTTLDLRPPKDLGKLVRRIADADTKLEGARQRATVADDALDTHERSIVTLPNPATLESQIARRRTQDALLARQEQVTAELAEAEISLEQRHRQLDGAELARSETTEKLERLRRMHAAHELAATVKVGDPCPVCGVPIAELPSVEPIEDLERAHADVTARTADLDAARKALSQAEVASATSKTMVEGIATQIASLRRELEGVPGVDELARALEATKGAHERLAELKEAARLARKGALEAELHRAELTEERNTALATFQAARDRVAHLEPPPAVTDDLAAAWIALTDWATVRAEEVRGRLDTLRIGTKQLLEDKTQLASNLEQHLAGVGSGIMPEEAVFSARRDLEEIQEAKRRTTELIAGIKTEEDRSAVAAALARHLRSNRFESWIFEEALVELTVGANHLLDELSSGAYSLEVDNDEFGIIDHRNADQRRLVRTLSGGETFLVSLALALSLSEQLTRMSSQGKLESIFLDEGFGTLDQETLDVVASVVQQLGAKGLTVGLISHVSDLAEQVPTRFVVTKDVGGAHVERVDA